MRPESERDAAQEVDAEAMRELARKMYWFQDEDGMWVIHAKLPPEQGQLVVKALQAVARPLAEERQEEWQAKQKARMQAVARKILQRDDATTEVSADGSSPEENSENTAGDAVPNHVAYARAEEKISAETFSQHMNQVRADALVAMVEHFLASGPDYPGPAGTEGVGTVPGRAARGHQHPARTAVRRVLYAWADALRR